MKNLKIKVLKDEFVNLDQGIPIILGFLSKVL